MLYVGLRGLSLVAVILAAGASAARAEVTIEIGNPGPRDDYLC